MGSYFYTDSVQLKNKQADPITLKNNDSNPNNYIMQELLPIKFIKYLDKEFCKVDLKNSNIFNKKEIKNILNKFDFDHSKFIIRCSQLCLAHHELICMIIHYKPEKKNFFISFYNKEKDVFYIISQKIEWDDNMDTYMCEYSLNVNDERKYLFDRWYRVQEYFDRIYYFNY